MNFPPRSEPSQALPVLLVRREKAASILDIAPTSFDKIVETNPLLRPVRIGRSVRWPYENLLAYVRELRELNDAADGASVWDECAVTGVLP